MRHLDGALLDAIDHLGDAAELAVGEEADIGAPA